MLIRWVFTAKQDLTDLLSWYEKNSPEYLVQVAQEIWNASQSLQQLPLRGRTGFIEGTRELLVPRLPYMLVYIVTENEVAILRLLHQHQNWPSTS